MELAKGVLNAGEGEGEENKDICDRRIGRRIPGRCS